MRIFFDTEFTGLHQNTTLISIGCIADNERTFYAELDDYDQDQLDNWTEINVIFNLYPDGHEFINSEQHFETCGEKDDVAFALNRWLNSFGEPIQMISDCLSYDWVLFCQLWGHAFRVPEFVSPAPRDINQDIADFLGIDECAAFNVNREKFAYGEFIEEMQTKKHNALWDAKVIKACYERLITMPEVMK